MVEEVFVPVILYYIVKGGVYSAHHIIHPGPIYQHPSFLHHVKFINCTFLNCTFKKLHCTLKKFSTFKNCIVISLCAPFCTKLLVVLKRISEWLGSATSKRVFPNRTAPGVPSGDPRRDGGEHPF